MKVNKNKENIDWLEKTIEKGYGSRCRDFNKDCFCCKAWEFFDSLRNYCLPKCDFHGKCKKCFYTEQKRLRKMNKKFVWSGLEEIERVRDYKT